MTCYGETESQFSVSLGEHWRLSALRDKRVNNNKKLATKDHCLFFNHVGLFEDFQF